MILQHCSEVFKRVALKELLICNCALWCLLVNWSHPCSLVVCEPLFVSVALLLFCYVRITRMPCVRISFRTKQVVVDSQVLLPRQSLFRMFPLVQRACGVRLSNVGLWMLTSMALRSISAKNVSWSPFSTRLSKSFITAWMSSKAKELMKECGRHQWMQEFLLPSILT